MLDKIRDYSELIVAVASVASLALHTFGLDETAWGKKIRAMSLDLVTLFKKEKTNA